MKTFLIFFFLELLVRASTTGKITIDKNGIVKWGDDFMEMNYRRNLRDTWKKNTSNLIGKKGIERMRKMLENIKNQMNNSDLRTKILYALCEDIDSECHGKVIKAHLLNEFEIKSRNGKLIELVELWSNFLKDCSKYRKELEEEFCPETFKLFIKLLIENLTILGFGNNSFKDLSAILTNLTNDDEKKKYFKQVVMENPFELIELISDIFELDEDFKKMNSGKIYELVSGNIFLATALCQYCQKNNGICDFNCSSHSKFDFIQKTYIPYMKDLENPHKTLNQEIKKDAIDKYRLFIENFLKLSNESSKSEYLKKFKEDFLKDLHKNRGPFRNIGKGEDPMEWTRQSDEWIEKRTEFYNENSIPLMRILNEMRFINSNNDHPLLTEAFNKLYLEILSEFFVAPAIEEGISLAPLQIFPKDDLLEASLMSSHSIDTIHKLFIAGIKINPSLLDTFKTTKKFNKERIQKYKSWMLRDYHDHYTYDSETFINGIVYLLESGTLIQKNNVIDTCERIKNNYQNSIFLSSSSIRYRQYQDCLEGIYWSYFVFKNENSFMLEIRKRMYMFLKNKIIISKRYEEKFNKIENQDHSTTFIHIIASQNLDYDQLALTSKIQYKQIKEKINEFFENYLENSGIYRKDGTISTQSDQERYILTCMEIIRGLYFSLDSKEFREWDPTIYIKKYSECVSKYLSGKEVDCAEDKKEAFLKLYKENYQNSLQIIRKFKMISNYRFYLAILGKTS